MLTFGELDVMYYRCLNSSLRGDMKKTELYFSLIENCFKDNSDKVVLKSYLDQDKLHELKRVKREVELGKPILELEAITPIDENIEPTAHDLKLERELVKLSYYSLQDLAPFLGDDLVCKGIERETYLTGGKCDMVAQDNNGTIYPIEFKLNQANHSVVSQIDKYCLHFKLQLIQKLYKRVKGVVIASSFSKYAINALLKKNIICLQYSCENNIVTYKQIRQS
jgi:hypothetical protein